MEFRSHVDILAAKYWATEVGMRSLSASSFGETITSLRKGESGFADHSMRLLDPWIYILEYAIELLETYHLAFSHGAITPINVSHLVFSFEPRKASRLACAIRAIILQGYDDAAWILLRSMIESTGILALCSFNKAAADAYDQSFNHTDSNQFWYDFVSKGKLTQRLKEIYSDIQARGEWSELGTEPIGTELSVILGDLSHATPSGGFRSKYTRSLEHPPGLDDTSFGRVAANAPDLLRSAYLLVLEFSYLYLAGLASGHITIAGNVGDDDATEETVLAIFAKHQVLAKTVAFFDNRFEELDGVLDFFERDEFHPDSI